MKLVAGLMALALALPAWSAANATVIDFEDLAVGATVSSQYAGLGVTFSPNAFSGAGGPSGPSGPWATNTDLTVVSSTGGDVGGLGTPPLVSGHILRSFSGWLNENGDPSFSISFASAITAFSMDFAGVSTPSDVRLFAYNGATIVGLASGLSGGQFTLNLAAPSITRVAVAPGSFNDWVGVDNISFTGAVAGVPEPAAWLTMLLGFAGLGAALRARRAAPRLA